MSTISPMSVFSIPLPAKRAKAKKEVEYRLYQCTYGCKHLWISSKDSFVAKCPACVNVHAEMISPNVHPELHFKKMIAVTFAGTVFYGYESSNYSKYKKDSLLDTLESQGFKNIKVGSCEVVLENALKEQVVFKFARKRKTTEVYVGLHNENDPLFKTLLECAKVDKKNKAAEPAPKPKPKIASMKDARGNEVTVGSWVCAGNKKPFVWLCGSD
jgi:hypothetical protein